MISSRPGATARTKRRARNTPAGKLIQKSGGLSEPFIRRPVMTVLLSVAIIAFGLLTYRTLPVNDLPAVDYPVINVSCSYPGASPETMANNIATPLEKQFLLINGLTLITSNSTQSSTSLTLQFDLSKTLADAATDVQAAIQRATGQLPIDLPSPPTFTKTNPNDQPIILLGLVTDTLTDADLYKFANTVVAQQISILPGVSQVQVYGVKGAVRVKADPSALVNRDMTMDDLAAGIKAGTAYSGAGQFDGAHRTFVLQPNGQLDSPDQYRNLIVSRGKDGSPIFLKDVATVYNGLQDERMVRYFWVRELAAHPPGSTVVLAVSRQAGSNAVEVADAVKNPPPHPARGAAGVDPAADGVRPFADHRGFGQRRADDALYRVRAGGAGDFRVPRSRGGHAHPGGGLAALAAADIRGHVHARLQREQPDADGADPGHRFPRR